MAVMTATMQELSGEGGGAPGQQPRQEQQQAQSAAMSGGKGPRKSRPEEIKPGDRITATLGYSMYIADSCEYLYITKIPKQHTQNNEANKQRARRRPSLQGRPGQAAAQGRRLVLRVPNPPKPDFACEGPFQIATGAAKLPGARATTVPTSQCSEATAFCSTRCSSVHLELGSSDAAPTDCSSNPRCSVPPCKALLPQALADSKTLRLRQLGP